MELLLSHKESIFSVWPWVQFHTWELSSWSSFPLVGSTNTSRRNGKKVNQADRNSVFQERNTVAKEGKWELYTSIKPAGYLGTSYFLPLFCLLRDVKTVIRHWGDVSWIECYNSIIRYYGCRGLNVLFRRFSFSYSDHKAGSSDPSVGKCSWFNQFFPDLNKELYKLSSLCQIPFKDRKVS